MAVKLPPIRVTFSYVLILEWLAPSDKPTGELLFQSLQKAGMRCEFVRCQTEAEIIAAIERAQTNVAELGIPAIHIEAHGEEPSEDLNLETGFGNNSGARMDWRDLGRLLAPLNRVCRFELLLVAAACFSAAAEAAMGDSEHSAPFAACIGITTSVGEMSLRDAMQELYRALSRDDDIFEAVASAHREFYNAGESMELFTAAKAAYLVLMHTDRAFRSSTQVEAHVDRIIAVSKARGKDLGADFRARAIKRHNLLLRRRIEEAWNIWFPVEIQAEIPGYRLDWEVVGL